MVGLEENQDLRASHLQKILKDDSEQGSNLIDDDMAIRFVFIIACNKLLFPSTDNNIRCKDVFLTRELSRLSEMNWCQAVVDDLRNVVRTWQVDKTKKGTPSLSGCSIFLIVSIQLIQVHYFSNFIHLVTKIIRCPTSVSSSKFLCADIVFGQPTIQTSDQTHRNSTCKVLRTKCHTKDN